MLCTTYSASQVFRACPDNKPNIRNEFPWFYSALPDKQSSRLTKMSSSRAVHTCVPHRRFLRPSITRTVPVTQYNTHNITVLHNTIWQMHWKGKCLETVQHATFKTANSKPVVLCAVSSSVRPIACHSAVLLVLFLL
jgi:hypothetical protein